MVHSTTKGVFVTSLKFSGILKVGMSSVGFLSRRMRSWMKRKNASFVLQASTGRMRMMVQRIVSSVKQVSICIDRQQHRQAQSAALAALVCFRVTQASPRATLAEDTHINLVTENQFAYHARMASIRTLRSSRRSASR